MSALAFSLTPQGVVVVKKGSVPIFIEKGGDVALVEAVHQALTLDVTKLLVCRGPGSFTSVRVVLSFAAGLCAARPHLQCLSATSFELLAHESGGTGWMLVYSHQGYFYGQLWENNAPLNDACRLSCSDIPSNGLHFSTPCPQPVGMVINQPQAVTLMDMYSQGKLTASGFDPFYVHNPDFKPHKHVTT